MEKFKLEPVSGGYVTVPKTDEHPLLCLLHNGEPFGEVGSLCQFDSVETFVPHLRSVAKQYGLAALCRVLFNSNEFLFLP